tara:strand:+ start:28 stop:936 length:909 start_codon:yes stop_codon:yes gene_type:complete
MKFIVSILILLLLSCESQKEEDVKVSLTYNHEQTRQRSIRTPIVVSKHTIDVKDYNYKHIYDSTELDSSTLTGTVEVPVNVNLEVEYKNYTLEQPQIHYESGISSPFIVTHSSPPTTTVTISVAINPDYPVQETETIDNETTECTENCIVDNVTISTSDNVTLVWSDNFTKGVRATQTQTNTYIAFWDNASNYQWDNISIGNTDNMTLCDNSTLVNNTIQNFDNTTYEFRGVYCNGMYWTFGRCGWGNEISAHDQDIKDCSCRRSNDLNSYTVRPLISNANWGGVGKSCGANSQTLQVILKR